MAVDAANMKVRFPELSCLDNDVIDRWLAESTRYLNETQWGPKFDDGLAYHTAHMISVFESSALGKGEPGVGPVTSKREGSVSVSYGVADVFTKDGFGSTKYGRRYREILRGIFVTRCL